MSTRTQSKVIRKSLLIDRPLDVTYKLFTEEISEWWPDGYSVAGPGSITVMELQKGGRIFQRSTTGQQFELGKVKLFSPPKRVVFTWKQPQWEGSTEVEVTFTEEGQATRVALEHRGWEKIGKWAEDFRKDYDIGWDDILPLFVSHADGKKRSRKSTGKVPNDGPQLLKPDQLSSAVKKVLANPPGDGVLVHTIRGQVAKDSGVQEGDVVVSFAGTTIRDWSDYYKVHCSITNSQVVPLVVLRGGKKLSLKTPRTWIGGASAPLWEVKKGQPVPVRPKPTKHHFDFSILDGGHMETWYRHNNPQGKKIGYQRVVWHLDEGNLQFLNEGGYELMGHHHAVIRARISAEAPPKPIESHLEDRMAARTVQGIKEGEGRSASWRSEIGGEQRQEVLVHLPSDAMLGTAGHAICAFMTRKEGATWAWTPIDEYSGRVALPVATVCRGVEKVKSGRTELDAWRFDVVRVGRALTSMWVSEENVIVKVQSQGGILMAVDRVEALKSVPSKLRPTTRA